MLNADDFQELKLSHWRYN